LNDVNDPREIAFSTMRAVLPESAYRFLTASGGEWDAPLTGEPFDWPQPPPAGELDLRKPACYHANTRKTQPAFRLHRPRRICR